MAALEPLALTRAQHTLRARHGFSVFTTLPVLDVPHRVAPGGLANADRVMEQGLILPMNHAIDDEGIAYICQTIDAFFA